MSASRRRPDTGGPQIEVGPLRYREGDVIADKYRLDERLGEGGMGEVWRARNLALDVDVAIKLVHGDLLNADTTTRLRQEAHAAARLEHPAAVRVFDLGDTPLGDFSVNLNSAQMLRYYMAPNSVGEQLAEGQKNGEINAGLPITAGGDFVGKSGRPRWRHSLNLTWAYGPARIGAFIKYTDAVDVIDVVDANNNPFVVKSQTSVNLFGSYRFEDSAGFIRDASVQVGVRNLFNDDPPFAPNGYLAALYQPQPRYWYLNIKKSF